MRQLKIAKQITNRESLSLDKYLTEISKMEMISAEQEVDLARRIADGDGVALQKLVSANLRFVVSVSKQYQNLGLSLSDLINEGNVGLVKAASRFDATRGFKFISYAVWWIRQSILQAIAEQSRVVRLPLNRVGNLNRIARAQSALEQKFQREPSREELAADLGIAVEEVDLSQRMGGRQVSMNAPTLQDEEGSLLDLLSDPNDLPPDAKLLSDSLSEEVRRMLGTLTSRESEVIVYAYGLNGAPLLSLDEIGVRFDITSERVRQIKDKATRKMRHSSRSSLLREYLG